ncbi:hypothetical protein [Pararhodobacter marinus]|nr:hypothetical protein [Pararhodobacter marinus]
MTAQTNTALHVAATKPGSSLPAGAGIALAMVLGGAIWVGIFALFL